MSRKAFVVLLLLLVLGLGAINYFIPPAPVMRTVEGTPMIDHDSRLFTDHQVGMQFTPPTGFAMQMRSTEAPTAHKAERTVVKYKRLIRGPKVAWLRVSLGDVTGDPTPAELLKSRKPREANFAVTKPIEDGLTIGGRPAARITFGGLMNPDSSGERKCSAEVTCVRHGPAALYFMATYSDADTECRDMLRAAIESVIFDPKLFAKE